MLQRTASAVPPVPTDAAAQPLGAFHFWTSLTASGDNSGPSSPVSVHGDDVRTIFVTGFPHDTQDRELHHLLDLLPGYEACQLHTRPGPGALPQGFALFATLLAAKNALNYLNGRFYDTNFFLRAEMAHKNLIVKDDPSIWRAGIGRGRQASDSLVEALAALSAVSGGHDFFAPSLSAAPLGAVRAAAPRYQAAGAAAAAAAAGAGAGGSGGGVLGAPGPAGLAPAQPLGLLGGAALPGAGGGAAGFLYSNDNPPCNTLFVGNLGDGVDEEELHERFSAFHNYRQMKLQRKERQVMCFVEYADTPSAAAVHTAMQGAIFDSSDRGPVRIQYSKNPFGKRLQAGAPRVGMGMGMGGLPAPRAFGAAASAAAAAGAAAAAAGAGAGGFVGAVDGLGHGLGYGLAPPPFPAFGAPAGAGAAAAAATLSGAEPDPIVPMANALGALAASTAPVGDLAAWSQFSFF